MAIWRPGEPDRRSEPHAPSDPRRPKEAIRQRDPMAAVGVHDDQGVRALLVGGKRDPGAVGRPDRVAVRRLLGGQQGEPRAVWLHDADVSAELDDQSPRTCQAERRRETPLRSGSHDGSDHQCEQQDDEQHQPGGYGLRPDAWPSVGQPPAGQEPGRPLPSRVDPGQRRLQQAGRGAVRAPPFEVRGQLAIEARALGHRIVLIAKPSSRRLSASSAARMAAVARWSRDLNVPLGTPSISAASSSDRPR